MKNLISKSTLFLIFISLTSCGSIKVASDYDSEADFSNYKTFAFYKSGIDKVEISDIDKKRILSSIEQSMNLKGYNFSNSPDLIVNISTKSREDIYVNRFNDNYFYGWGPYSYSQSYRPSSRVVGLLYIDVVDSKNGNLVWQGNGSGSLYSSKYSRDELINNFVNKVLESFPAKS